MEIKDLPWPKKYLIKRRDTFAAVESENKEEIGEVLCVECTYE